ncbi:formyltransferase family protein [Mycobacteroides abscessus]|uniref:formyltransferase family protein n=1 Tax=Mycobacteroides abscessus TaxID=36809 RepID=UPI0021044730|nr:formyltransferase family protein [Mycobacteroides abscessus]
MNIITLTSATGNNMAVTDRELKRHGHTGVALNISDVARCGAVGRAAVLNIPTVVYEPAMPLAADRDGRRAAQRRYHDHLACLLRQWESWNGRIDLIVLAYHRFIEGEFLTHYGGRIINQHPGDLTVHGPDGQRLFIGMRAVGKAFELQWQRTRTTTILVDDRLDGGPIIARGPAVDFLDRYTEDLEQYLRDHEERQKTVSDTPALAWVLESFLAGSLRFADLHGRPWPYLEGTPLPAEGYSVGEKPW